MITNAKSVALQLPFTAPTPLEFKLDEAADVITLDRLVILKRVREISTEMNHRGEMAHVLGVADLLEKEIREAGK